MIMREYDFKIELLFKESQFIRFTQSITHWQTVRVIGLKATEQLDTKKAKGDDQNGTWNETW